MKPVSEKSLALLTQELKTETGPDKRAYLKARRRTFVQIKILEARKASAKMKPESEKALAEITQRLKMMVWTAPPKRHQCAKATAVGRNGETVHI